MDPIDDGLKCGVLCFYLPGFAKGKPVRTKKEEVRGDLGNVISRTVSLEKFECGSWASSAIINDHEDDSKNLYFDLPLELIQASANDANSPVSAAFIFDKDRKQVLKSCSTRAAPRNSHEFSRHVRFSTSLPTSHPTSPTSCITPRCDYADLDDTFYPNVMHPSFSSHLLEISQRRLNKIIVREFCHFLFLCFMFWVNRMIFFRFMSNFSSDKCTSMKVFSIYGWVIFCTW
jgi:hypothetical protein